MNRILLFGTAVLLASCTSESARSTDNVATNDNSAADAHVQTIPAEIMSLRNTTWEFSDGGTPMVISINQAGSYIELRGDGTLFDHGTYAQKDGKDCFTSAMGDQATNCWTGVPNTAIGRTASASDDKGNSGIFKRVDYRVLKLPAS